MDNWQTSSFSKVKKTSHWGYAHEGQPHWILHFFLHKITWLYLTWTLLAGSRGFRKQDDNALNMASPKLESRMWSAEGRCWSDAYVWVGAWSLMVYSHELPRKACAWQVCDCGRTIWQSLPVNLYQWHEWFASPQAAILLQLIKKSAISMVLTTTVLGVISPKEVGESCDQNQERDESETDRLFNMRYGTRQEPHNCPWIQVRCDRYTKWQKGTTNPGPPPVIPRSLSPDNPAPPPLLFERDC